MCFRCVLDQSLPRPKCFSLCEILRYFWHIFELVISRDFSIPRHDFGILQTWILSPFGFWGCVSLWQCRFGILSSLTRNLISTSAQWLHSQSDFTSGMLHVAANLIYVSLLGSEGLPMRSSSQLSLQALHFEMFFFDFVYVTLYRGRQRCNQRLTSHYMSPNVSYNLSYRVKVYMLPIIEEFLFPCSITSLMSSSSRESHEIYSPFIRILSDKVDINHCMFDYVNTRPSRYNFGFSIKYEIIACTCERVKEI